MMLTLKKLSKKPVIAMTAIAVAVLLAYGNSLRGGFVFDDQFILADAPIHRDAGLRNWFPPHYYQVAGERSYRPVTTLSYVAQSKIESMFTEAAAHPGPVFSPVFYRGANVALHFGVACGLWLLARCWLGSGFALFASLLFAVYPVTAETVNVTGFREELLVALFALGAMMLFRRWCRAPGGPTALILAAAGVLLAGLSKETGYVMPLVLGLTAAAELGPWNRRMWLGGAFLFALGALGGLVCIVLLQNRVIVHHAWLADYHGARWPLIGPLLSTHLRILLAPYPLIADRTFLAAEAGSAEVMALVTILLGVVLAAGALWAWMRNKTVFVGLVWMLVPLAPVMGFMPLPNPVAERYYYVPALGAALLWGAVAQQAWQRMSAFRWRAALFLVAGAVVLSGGVALTVQRNADWSSEAGLWMVTLRQNPRSIKANENIGYLLMHKGRPARALPYLRRAIRLDPFDSRLQENLAVALAMTGDIDAGIKVAEGAIRDDLVQPSLFMNLCAMWMNRRDPSVEQALTYYRCGLASGATRNPEMEKRLGLQNK